MSETGDNKEKYVYNVFQSIAGGYDRANRRISLSQHIRWKKEAVRRLCRNLPEGAGILDLGCGTGDMLSLIHKEREDARLTGVDFSPNMLKAAGKRLGNKEAVSLIEANVLKLPFNEETFDAACISFALRNTADYDKALKEAFRVLKKGGRFVCIDSFVPESRMVRPFYSLYFSVLMPFLGGGLKKLKEYLWLKKSTEAFLTAGELGRMMKKTGFIRIREKSFLFGACMIVSGRKTGKRETKNDK